MTTTDNLAILTKEQDRRYGKLFEIAVAQGHNPENTDEDSADAEAWRGLCEEWPELARYDGARAGYAE